MQEKDNNPVPQIKDIISVLEKLAPPSYQEVYDNAGLLTGNANDEVKGVLLCLDSTEKAIDEAIANNCNMVVAHHPIIFSGLKRITGKTYVERAVIKAIKNDVAIYAIHTNLDNVLHGVNKMICERLGLINASILLPKSNLLKKLVTFAPTDHAEKVRNALFGAGAGHIGAYSHCSFNTTGMGTFMAGKDATPYVGEKEKLHTENEVRIEVVFESRKEGEIISRLLQNHPYEEVAYDIYGLANKLNNVGSGMVGELPEAMPEKEILLMLKKNMQAAVVKHTNLRGKPVKKVAVCGGAGIFLLQEAIRQGADVFITSDIKYHEYFDADGKIVLADIGHYESEQFTAQLIMNELKNNFSTFALRLTNIVTNPVNYL
ncbi:MAG TPA: Nif3-like dinuclear metal center hexameric protein [Bacteroidia bacterium]|nr:Nif3-like dinuclear metal center hexameric protein [Bacteroidia bacterium]